MSLAGELDEEGWTEWLWNTEEQWEGEGSRHPFVKAMRMQLPVLE